MPTASHLVMGRGDFVPHVSSALADNDHKYEPTMNSAPPTNGTSLDPHHVASSLRFQSPLSVRCEVRTRIPSEFGGECSLHLYSNTHDNEEHMAIVYGDDIRSSSLDEWRPGDDARERMLRGAKVLENGNVNGVNAVEPATNRHSVNGSHVTTTSVIPPLVRIHSCCFTGETLGSLRCDCAEQLQEAMRMMSVEGRGVVLYLKQEGRGIGLREKLRAYNLIDQGHDTQEANILLGHPADARTYEIASAILRDLEISTVRLLTNNPDKMQWLTKDGVGVVERVGMVPRSWRVLDEVEVEADVGGEEGVESGRRTTETPDNDSQDERSGGGSNTTEMMLEPPPRPSSVPCGAPGEVPRPGRGVTRDVSEGGVHAPVPIAPSLVRTHSTPPTTSLKHLRGGKDLQLLDRSQHLVPQAQRTAQILHIPGPLLWRVTGLQPSRISDRGSGGGEIGIHCLW
ncbi:GTP cyclohydrolase II [Rhizophlyctis rosea]|nr:GTP cyclohydrolase II [Rhizophlyctis rosea]